MRSTKLLIAALAASALIAATPGLGRAATYHGYVCEVAFLNHSPQYGQHGHVSVQFRTEPACGGSAIGHPTFCSTGATATNCAALPLSERAILALYEGLRSAAAAGQRLRIETVTVASTILYFVYFRAD